MKNQIKTIKRWLAFILTVLVVATLFGIIFISTELVQLTPSFFMELSIVLALTFMMKLWWYDFAEDKALNDDDVVKEKENYYKIVDETILDTNDLENYLVILNQENKDHFVSTKMGSRTVANLGRKTPWLLFWHPSFRKKTEKEIGEYRYDKLYFKYQRKADKLRPVKSEEIMALSNSGKVLYDTKNHVEQKKRTYQFFTTIVSFVLTTALSSLMMKEIMLNWANAFRFVSYLCAMAFTVATTLITGYKQTRNETFDYFNRLKFIVDKYATYKESQQEVEHAADN